MTERAAWSLTLKRLVAVTLFESGSVEVVYYDATRGHAVLTLDERGWKRGVLVKDAPAYWEMHPACGLDTLLRGFFALIAADEALQPEPLATLWHEPKTKRDASPVRK